MRSLRKQHGNSITVTRKESEVSKEQIVKLVSDILKRTSGKAMSLPELKRKIEKKYPSFKISDYQYSRFSQFVKDMDGLTVRNNTVCRKGNR